MNMMIVRRTLACCARDKEISIDFGEQESKIPLLCSFYLFFSMSHANFPPIIEVNLSF